MTIPDWLSPVRVSAEQVTVDRLTRFEPPEDFDGRDGAVLMLFGDGAGGRDLLLTERAHHMRSHPGQVSFPGGAMESGESARQAALREAQEETGLDPAGIEVFGELPRLWLPPSNFAVTPVLGWWHTESPVRAVDADEVHAVYRVPLEELLEPRHRISVRHPRVPGYTSPAFLIGADKELVLWGFTAGIIARVFDLVGWTRPWDAADVRDLPRHMVHSEPARGAAGPDTDPRAEGER